MGKTGLPEQGLHKAGCQISCIFCLRLHIPVVFLFLLLGEPPTIYPGFAMVYDMQYVPGALFLLLLILAAAAGCTTSPAAEPPVTPAAPTPELTTSPTPESTQATVEVADMALQLSDLPPDYILRDRSVMTSPEVSQLTRDLGWRQGYFVTFDRTGRTRNDQTRIRQSINIFPAENMNKVFLLEKVALSEGTTPFSSPYEIPFPPTGDRSIAYRMTNTPEEGQVTYTVIFTKKNAFERITMAGTSTDYETLKDIAEKAAARIR